MKAPEKDVECVTMWGQVRRFPAEALRFRPAAYGIAVRDGQVLVARSRFTGRWELPGGAVAPWEKLEDGLVREYREETGVTVSVRGFVGFDQGFVAFFQHPFNSLRFFFRVDADAAELRAQKSEVDEVRWMPIAELDEADMAAGHWHFLQECMRP
ncbi:MAG: NUDIX domain-containing protein [Bacillota bacterium]